MPAAAHTLLDACTATNRLLGSSDEAEQLFGLLLGLGAVAVMFALQIRVLRAFKRKAGEYCGMRLN